MMDLDEKDENLGNFYHLVVKSFFHFYSTRWMKFTQHDFSIISQEPSV